MKEIKINGKSYSWRPLEWTLFSENPLDGILSTALGTYTVSWMGDAFLATGRLRILGRYPTPDEAKKACEDDYRKSVIDEFFNEEKRKK